MANEVCSITNCAQPPKSPSTKKNQEIETCGFLSINSRIFALTAPKNKKQKRVTSKCKETAENRVLLQPEILVCMTDARYSIIRKIAQEFEWKFVRESDIWNLHWSDAVMGVDFCREMRRFQKINHLPGMYEICRKDLLARNLNRMLKQFPDSYQIFPKTWCFPADYSEAIKYADRHPRKTYILKPYHGAQGHGISLVRCFKDINPEDKVICQVYISRPLLIDDFKFDLRIYALITSIDPLRIYVFNEGLARFATSPYRKLEDQNIANVYMHLTNYSVNKHSQTYSKDDEDGSKRKFSTINRILSNEGYDVVSLWNDVDDTIIKTVLSAWPMLRHNYKASFPNHDIIQACFEILGFDIIIDENMKPWLLEVNHSPSFNTDGPVDEEVKGNLLRDTFTILNIGKIDKRKILREDREKINKRLIKKLKEIQVTASEKIKTVNTSHPITACTMKKVDTEPVCKEKCEKSRYYLEQVEWEENHLGGFRRIFPCAEDTSKYGKFCCPNKASIFCDTIASKKREEAAMHLRSQLAKRCNEEKSKIIDPKPQRKPKSNIVIDPWKSYMIKNDAAERERLAYLKQRFHLIKSCNLENAIRSEFYKNNLLSSEERIQYEQENHIDSSKVCERLSIQDIHEMCHENYSVQIKF